MEIFKQVQNTGKFYSFKTSILYQFQSSYPLEARWGQVGDLWCPAVKELIPELCPQGICAPFGDLIMSLAPPHLMASCIPLDACDSPFSTLPWHGKHHPSPIPANIISEPIFHTSQELGSKWGQHRPRPRYPLVLSSCSLYPLPF